MMTPDLPFWTRLLLRLAVEAAGLVGAAWLLDRLIRPAFWRRALWQGAVVCLLLLTASELSGFGRGLASFLIGHARPEPKFAVWTSPVESAPSPFPSPAASFAPAPITVPSTVATPEIARPVWWPGLLWLAGGLAVLGRVATAQILFISLRRRRPVVTQTDLKGRVHAILQRLAFRRKIRLLQSPGLTGPIAFGILRPSVALPVDFAAKFSRAEQDAMLAHELAHLASRDPLWYLLADLSSAALWWHPQAWWARRRLHRASELAADESAAIFPEGPAALAECLVALGRQMTQCHAASRMGVEGGFRSNLAERVQRLLRLADTARQPSYGWPARAAKILAIIAIAAAAVGLSGCLQSRDAVKEPTLQANLSQSWNASPASTVWHSALPPKNSEPSSAPKPVKFQPAAKETASLSMGIFHVEPNSCIQALRHLFPKDGDAQAGAMVNRYFESVGINLTNDGSFTLINPRTGDILARATMRNLDSMAQAIDLLNKIPPVDSVDRAKELVNKTRTASSIFLDKQPERASPETGQQRRVSDLERAALEKGQQIRVIPLDTNTFLQGLQEVFPQIVPRPDGATEATGGLPYLIGTNGASGRNSLFTQCFASIGINLTDNAGWIVFDQRTGAVLVWASSQDMDVVDHVIQFLNKVPPQVQIDAKVVSLPQNDDKGVVGFQTYLGTFAISNGVIGAQTNTVPSFTGTNRYANPSGIFPGPAPAGSNPGQIAPAASDGSLTDAALRTVAPNAPISGPSLAPLGTITGILTDPQFHMAIQAIEQREGADILSMPRITTLSGREAHVAVRDIVDVITRLRTGSNAAAAGNATNTFEEGPALDVIPTVNADGYAINLVLNATLLNFLGYDKPAQIGSRSNAVSSLQKAGPTNPAPPMPRYRSFSRAATINVWDGQTVLLGGPMQESDPSQKQSTNSQREDVMVFITATIIDPAGNRVHKEEDMPFAKESVPSQPQNPSVPK
jgi:beta-lactamase regulating signal transducer with metallopeptidase domain/type II secretory pathway component GspD/PulD (secretin)